MFSVWSRYYWFSLKSRQWRSCGHFKMANVHTTENMRTCAVTGIDCWNKKEYYPVLTYIATIMTVFTQHRMNWLKIGRFVNNIDVTFWDLPIKVRKHSWLNFQIYPFFTQFNFLKLKTTIYFYKNSFYFISNDFHSIYLSPEHHELWLPVKT